MRAHPTTLNEIIIVATQISYIIDCANHSDKRRHTDAHKFKAADTARDDLSEAILVTVRHGSKDPFTIDPCPCLAPANGPPY